MLTSELVELVGMIRRQKAEGQTIEVKAAEKGCPQKLYDTCVLFVLMKYFIENVPAWCYNNLHKFISALYRGLSI